MPSNIQDHIQQHQDTVQTLLQGVDSPLPMWINGSFVTGKDAALPIVDPFLNETCAHSASASLEQLNQAIKSAQIAQTAWKKQSSRDRAKVLKSISTALKNKRNEMALAESINVGLPQMVSSRFSVSAMIRSYEYFAEWSDKIYSHVIPTNTTNVLDITLHEPMGVVGVITAWNTAALFLGSKVAPALAAGNAVIIKPSERALLPAFIFCQALEASDLPPGLINVVYGDATIGKTLVQHDQVDCITFTGGTEIGKNIASQAGLKPTCFELGGKSPSIVFPDADINAAAFQLLGGAFALSGQACAASSRIILHDSIYDEFINTFKKLITMMPMGDPLKKSTVLGPLISQSQVDRTMMFIENAKQAGSQLIFGGTKKTDGIFAKGNFVEPTIFANVDPDSPLAQEEVFGPIVSIFKFNTDKEAITIANNTRYGLAGSVWSNDIKKAHRTAASLEAGYVWINAYGNIPYTTPFGGYKESGKGREGGREALLEFMRLKNIYIQL